MSPVVGLYSAAGVDPEVSQVVAICLLAAEHDLLTASLTSAIILYQIREGDFFGPPSMREYRVGWDHVAAELVPGEVAMSIQRQQAHGLQDAF
jgi:hypothetical protein